MRKLHRPIRKSSSGVALIIVLSSIVLVTALVLAFTLSSRTDLLVTAEYVAGQDATRLAETATGLVMAQIREATLAGIDAQGRGTRAWASQPGAIRVWDDHGKKASPYVYKLYSAAKMKEDDLNFLTSEIPADWRSRTNAYTDLNEPVSRSNSWRYPILNPAALGQVEGFSSTQAADNSVPWDARVSMPVRWLYIGDDGKLSGSVQSNSVGRIAFWTDDETCKVNINTASAAELRKPQGGGDSFWSMPMSRLRQDYDFGRFVPDQNEFQRYPGHPATVNLLAVLKSSFSQKEIFDLLPRYTWGGSENGQIFPGSRTIRLAGIVKNQRLFASSDELRFDPGRNPVKISTPAPWISPEEFLRGLTPFLTATSRAPDLNLFGQPRVCLWPVHFNNDANHRTVFDNLIAKCATVGANEYYFLRKNPMSQTEDWGLGRNREIFEMLQRNTSRPIPGFEGSFVQKYDSSSGGVPGECNQILTEMYDWIRCVNLNETYSGTPAGYASYTENIDWTGEDPTNFLVNKSVPGAGWVLPILTPYGRGAGRVPVLSELALYFNERTIRVPGTPPTYKTDNEIQSFIGVETFSSMLGYMPMMPKDFQISMSTDMTLLGIPVYDNANTTQFSAKANLSIYSNNSGQGVGGTLGLSWPTSKLSANWPFQRTATGPVSSDGTISWSRGSFAIGFLSGGINYQNYEIEVPAMAGLPKPNWNPTSNIWLSFSGLTALNPRAGIEAGVPYNDVVRSMVPRDGDYRIISYLQNVPKEFFIPHPYFSDFTKPYAHSLRNALRTAFYGFTENDGSSFGSFISNANFNDPATIPASRIWRTERPDIHPGISDLLASGWEGDWDNGMMYFPDGAYLGKSDEGQIPVNYVAGGGSAPAYYNLEKWYRSDGFFSPTRQAPSGVVFGSLPTAVLRTAAAYQAKNFSAGRPWRTLLFSPNPDVTMSGGKTHFGATSPHDHLFLDFFNMPVVEPYAVSEPLSTAGRINMNAQILPFTDIRRTTGLYAVLSSQRVAALDPAVHGRRYKLEDGIMDSDTTEYRKKIDVAETLIQFSNRFAPNQQPENGDLFRSASEICTVFLVPEGVHFSNISSFWAGQRLTGNNLREQPYAYIYPLLTTKSNTYTVHTRVQTLARGTTNVTGEYRGSTTIERYIDPADERIGTGAGKYDPDKVSLEPLYRWRVVDNKKFTP